MPANLSKDDVKILKIRESLLKTCERFRRRYYSNAEQEFSELRLTARYLLQKNEEVLITIQAPDTIDDDTGKARLAGEIQRLKTILSMKGNIEFANEFSKLMIGPERLRFNMSSLFTFHVISSLSFTSLLVEDNRSDYEKISEKLTKINKTLNNINNIDKLVACFKNENKDNPKQIREEIQEFDKMLQLQEKEIPEEKFHIEKSPEKKSQEEKPKEEKSSENKFTEKLKRILSFLTAPARAVHSKVTRGSFAFHKSKRELLKDKLTDASDTIKKIDQKSPKQ